MPTPIVLVLEGLDFSGKSTLADVLVKWLRLQGRSVVSFRDPGSTDLSERIRAIVKDPAIECPPIAQMLLFSAARFMLAERVRAAHADGNDVILDRWWYSTLAYQGSQGVPAGAIEYIANELSPIPLTRAYYLDVSHEERRRRAARRAEVLGVDLPDRFDGAPDEFHMKLRSQYLAMVSRGLLMHIPADGPPSEMLRLIQADLDDLDGFSL